MCCDENNDNRNSPRIILYPFADGLEAVESSPNPLPIIITDLLLVLATESQL